LNGRLKRNNTALEGNFRTCRLGKLDAAVLGSAEAFGNTFASHVHT